LYTYLEELYGQRWGFLLGWVQTVISYPASVGAQSIAFALYVAYFIPLSTDQQRLVALGVLALLVVLNVLSTRCSGIIQMAATIGKLVPIVIILAMGAFSGALPGSAGMSGELIGAGMGSAVLGTLWAYDGWIGVTNMAGEMRNPRKNLPRVIVIGLVFVIAVYLAFNLVVFNSLSPEQLSLSETPGSDTAVALFGEKGAALISAGIMVSVFGSLNGYLMTGARVPQAMGEKGLLPASRVLAKIHPVFGTPGNALILQGVLAAIYVLSGTFNALTDILIFVLWIFFTMGVFGVFLLRKKGLSAKENYRVPLYPVVPAIGVAGGAFVLVSTLIGDPVKSLIGILLTLAGLPVFHLVQKRNQK
ncbi:MAG: amino acid permease, partial [Firmicutes bacterium]|nr:amino acid permease [Bacillota bacterium]